MTANTTHFSEKDCPVKEWHGNPFRYCGSCNWSEETKPVKSPDYVFDLIRALKDNTPLNFHGHEVPADIQAALSQLDWVRRDKHACLIDAEVDHFAVREQYIIGCQCHEGNVKHIWQPGDPAYVCPTSGVTVADPRTLIKQGD
jgi:hypothetical protein